MAGEFPAGADFTGGEFPDVEGEFSDGADFTEGNFPDVEGESPKTGGATLD